MNKTTWLLLVTGIFIFTSDNVAAFDILNCTEMASASVNWDIQKKKLVPSQSSAKGAPKLTLIVDGVKVFLEDKAVKQELMPIGVSEFYEPTGSGNRNIYSILKVPETGEFILMLQKADDSSVVYGRSVGYECEVTYKVISYPSKK